MLSSDFGPVRRWICTGGAQIACAGCLKEFAIGDAKRLLHQYLPKAEALDWTIILPFSQLGGLHGAQWSRSSDLKRIIEDQVTTAEFAHGR
jgi:hypothetical protein